MKLFRISGITIQLHYTWWFVFALLSWNLATSFFPKIVAGYDAQVYWLMGIASALLLFVSVLLHELSHSFVALAQKIKVENITLFFFGGVSSIPSEEMKPKTEFLMAVAGPLFSFVLAGVFYSVHILVSNPILAAMTLYLAQLNLVLGIFNIIPGFPLDGGRAFRAVLFAHYKDLVKATRIAVLGGRIFAGFLIVMGILSLVTATGNGVWFILLGGFLYFIAGVSYDQVVMTESLKGVPLAEVVSGNLTEVPAEMKFNDFVRKYAAAKQDVFLVRGKNFQGLFHVGLLPGTMPRKELLVRDVSIPLSSLKGLSLQDDAAAAFQKMQAQGIDFLPVLENGKVKGVVTRRVLATRLLWQLSGFTHSWRRLKSSKIKQN